MDVSPLIPLLLIVVGGFALVALLVWRVRLARRRPGGPGQSGVLTDQLRKSDPVSVDPHQAATRTAAPSPWVRPDAVIAPVAANPRGVTDSGVAGSGASNS